MQNYQNQGNENEEQNMQIDQYRASEPNQPKSSNIHELPPMNNIQGGMNENDKSMMSTIVTSDPICCSQCGSSIDIHQIHMEDGEYKLSFTCQNDHNVEDQSLIDFMASTPKECQEITTCKEHNDEKFMAYCKKCNKELCLECILEDDHKDDNRTIVNYHEAFPAKKEMKNFIEEKAKELEELDSTRNRFMDWLKNLEKRMDKLFQSQQALIEFQKAFVEHFTIRKTNYIKIKSLNYLMKTLRYNRGSNKISEKLFDKYTSPIEKQIYELVGIDLGDTNSSSKNKTSGSNTFRAKPKATFADEEELEITKSTGPINLKNLGSSVLKNDDDLKKLLNMFSRMPKGLKKIYSAIEGNGSARNFHKKCDNKGPTITLAKVAGNIIGGYTAKDWGSKNGHITDHNSFVFNLSNNTKFEADSGEGINSNPRSGPIFEGIKDKVLEIGDNAIAQKNSFSRYGEEEDFSGANLLGEMDPGDSIGFKCAEYEVYQVL